jgi:VWFA-related protein
MSCGGHKSLNLLSILKNLNLSGPHLSLSETTHNFPGVVLNNNADQEFTITNTGNEAGLKVSSISSDLAEFGITSENCTSQSLAQNASCTFIVRFSPAAQETFEGNISVNSNDPPTRTITLTGVGYGLNVWINQADFSDCSDVKVDVTVTNPAGPIDSLDTDGLFTLWQNNTELVSSVSPIVNPDPVSVVIALDLSSSLTSALDDIRTGAICFIEHLGDADKAAICKFKKDIIFYPLSSSSPLLVSTNAAGIIELKNKIYPPDPTTDGTALYNAVYDSITRAAVEPTNKKAVIVLSDGANNVTTGRTLEQVRDYAIEQNVPIFTIYYVDPASAKDAKPAIMRQLAEETGGQGYSADTSTMDSIFNQIRNMLGSKYTIHYDAGSNCSGSIPLRVRVDYNGLYGVDSRTFIIP